MKADSSPRHEVAHASEIDPHGQPNEQKPGMLSNVIQQQVTNSAQQCDKIEIRSATVDDAEAMARLSGQLGYQATSPETARRLEALMRFRDHQVYVAAFGAILVGWVHVHLRPSLLTDAEAEIAALVVDEKVRSRGIGRILVEEAERWAQEQGCRTIRLRSNAVRLRAHVFYERLGYESIKTSRVFRKTLS